MQRGVCGRGHAWQGTCVSCMPPPPDTTRYGQCMHPTGMHSCFNDINLEDYAQYFHLKEKLMSGNSQELI